MKACNGAVLVEFIQGTLNETNIVYLDVTKGQTVLMV